jgi:drug/metabolite transporter (DMT)-like permease
VYLFFPLISSLLYVVGTLFLKQATEHRIGVWRAAFICNWMTTLFFLTLYPYEEGFKLPGNLWEPASVALLFVIGQLFTFRALEGGDVSVVTPVLGVKVILVAILTTWILGETIPAKLWTGAAASCIGIGLLHTAPGSERHVNVKRTITSALWAAICYALFDVLVIKWSPGWGIRKFLPVMLLIAGFLSFIYLPMFREPLNKIPGPARKPLFLGSFFVGLQGLILITTIARFGDATAINIVYSSRGIWSVLAVWGIGHWFHNKERPLGYEILKWRLAGAALLTSAIVMVFI